MKFVLLKCTVYVNKMSPYSNSNYLSSTISIVQYLLSDCLTTVVFN